jgi:hypothetical protein
MTVTPVAECGDSPALLDKALKVALNGRGFACPGQPCHEQVIAGLVNFQAEL